MKKVAVVVLAMALLMLGVLAAPAMAVSPKKIEVTVDTLTSGTYSYIDMRITPGEVAHVEFGWPGTITLHTPTGDTLFNYVDDCKINDFTPDPDPTNNIEHKVGGVALVHEVWTNEEETGGFEGNAIWKESAPMFSLFTSNTVLQGFGIYKGQTLSLFGLFGVPPADNTYYGYLLIP